ncbi:hypothetical protein F5879DRAFT_1023311 [Lentinula edodes]|nr:hypothetical protein F5879DRAFT_1023311 [Lentinula edodes]
MSQSVTLKPTGASIAPDMNAPVAAGKSEVTPTTRLMTIQPPWVKRTINLVLIGETGVGKTAMLDLLANRTSRPCANGNEVNILDTPGLARTRGIDMDNEHKAAIANVVKKHFEVIDAVIILANGTLARLGAATEYALTTISGMFPNSIVDNIAFIFTMVSDPTSFNFERKSLPEELRKAKIWSINNPFAQWTKYQEKLAQDPPTIDEEILQEIDEGVHRSYTKALKMLGQVFQFLDKCKVQPTNSIYDFYIMSTDIEAAISNVIARMDQIENTRNGLKKLQSDKAAQEQGKKINEKYEEIINTPFYEHKNTGSKHNTLLTVTRAAVSGLLSIVRLLVATAAHFTIQPALVLNVSVPSVITLAEDHQHYRSKWVKRIKSGKVVDEDAKKRYDEAKTEADRIAIVMEGVEKNIIALEKGIVNLEKQLSELCEKYNQLALSGSFIGYITSAIRLLKLRQETVKKGLLETSRGQTRG